MLCITVVGHNRKIHVPTPDSSAALRDKASIFYVMQDGLESPLEYGGHQVQIEVLASNNSNVNTASR